MNRNLIASELLKAAKEMTAGKTVLATTLKPGRFSVGDKVWYNGEEGEVVKIGKGMYGEVYDVNYGEGKKISKTGWLDPSFTAKSKSEVNQRLQDLKKALGW